MSEKRGGGEPGPDTPSHSPELSEKILSDLSAEILSGVESPAEDATSLARRIEVGAEKLAHVLENITKLIAYISVLATWLIVGFVAWLATLFCGIMILIFVMVFRLVAGLQVERETNRFLSIMQFWPDGFTSLARAFWSEHHIKELEFGNQQSEPSYVFATLRIIYVVIVLYLLVCTYYNENPLTFLLTLPGNTVLAVFLIAVLTIGMSLLADARKARQKTDTSVASAPGTAELPG